MSVLFEVHIQGGGGGGGRDVSDFDMWAWLRSLRSEMVAGLAHTAFADMYLHRVPHKCPVVVTEKGRPCVVAVFSMEEILYHVERGRAVLYMPAAFCPERGGMFDEGRFSPTWGL